MLHFNNNQSTFKVDTALYNYIKDAISAQYYNSSPKVIDKRIAEVITVTYCNMYGQYNISLTKLKQWFNDNTLTPMDMYSCPLVDYTPPSYTYVHGKFINKRLTIIRSHVLEQFDKPSRKYRFVRVNNDCSKTIWKYITKHKADASKITLLSNSSTNIDSINIPEPDHIDISGFVTPCESTTINKDYSMLFESRDTTSSDNTLPWIVELTEQYKRIDTDNDDTMSYLAKGYCKFDDRYYRIYTPFHYVPKAFRHYLYDKETHSNIIELIDLHAAASIGVALYAYRILGKCSDTDSFFDLVMSGNLYEHIITWADENGYGKIGRDDIKMRVNAVYYASNNHSTDPNTTKAVNSFFKSNYPNIYKLIIDCRKMNTEDTVYMMRLSQQYELNIVSWTACQLNRELYKRGIPGVVLSLHDALFCSKQLIDTNVLSIFGVKQLLMDKIYSYRDRYRDGIL